MPQIPVTWDGVDSHGNPLTFDSGLTWDGFLPEEPHNPPKKMQLRVQLGFTVAPDNSLNEIAGAVLAGLYGNAAYPTPPVTSAALTTASGNFTTAIAAQAQGGTAATADKNNKRDILIDLLRQLAGYVQENHGNDLAKLLTSGFEAVSTNRASTPLEKPNIKDILNGNSGQLILRTGALDNAKCFQVEFALIGPGGTPGPWQPGGLFTNSRSMPINGLTPGAEYAFHLRGVGGSTGYSDWSDTRTHRSL